MITGSVKTGSTEMEYFSFGSGSRRLIILPGIGVQKVRASAKGVETAYSCFEQDYTVTVFDRKNDLPQGCTIAQMADDTALAMKALNIEKADFFGASMGGMIAQTMAINHPSLVRSLVLGSTLSRPNDTVLNVSRNWISLAQKGDVTAMAEKMINLLYSEKLAAQLSSAAALLFAGVTKADLDWFIIQARAISGFDVYDKLSLIHCPALVIGVENDGVVTAQASYELAEKLGCELYMYGGEYRHCVFDEAPDYKQRLMDFYNSII